MFHLRWKNDTNASFFCRNKILEMLYMSYFNWKLLILILLKMHVFNNSYIKKIMNYFINLIIIINNLEYNNGNY